MDCGDCPEEQPPVLPRNLAAWWFYHEIKVLLFNGMGGLNPGGLEAGFRQLKIPQVYRPMLFRKLLVLAGKILEPKDTSDG